MEKVIIRQAKIFDAAHDGAIQDILIADGKIEKIAPSISTNDAREITGNELVISDGWIDLGTQLCDPGLEHKETIKNGLQAAKTGGFQSIITLPDTLPTTTTKSQVDYQIQQAKSESVGLYPLGGITKDLLGKELAEMSDMSQAGAVGFCDGYNGLQNGDLMRKAMLYSKSVYAPLLDRPNEVSLAVGGQMHEGHVSTLNGLKGIPSIAETTALLRQIELVKYTETPLHIWGISAAESVEIIRDAKSKGLPITCSVAVANLCFTDERLGDFDSLYKTHIPLRAESDRQALVAGVNDGTIDIIFSGHSPQNIEVKNCEFQIAKPGMIMLETAYGALVTCANGLHESAMHNAFSTNVAQLFGIIESRITEGETATFSLFDAGHKWTPEAGALTSKSKNSPLLGVELTGKALAF